MSLIKLATHTIHLNRQMVDDNDLPHVVGAAKIYNKAANKTPNHLGKATLIGAGVSMLGTNLLNKKLTGRYLGVGENLLMGGIGSLAGAGVESKRHDVKTLHNLRRSADYPQYIKHVDKLDNSLSFNKLYKA